MLSFRMFLRQNHRAGFLFLLELSYFLSSKKQLKLGREMEGASG